MGKLNATGKFLKDKTIAIAEENLDNFKELKRDNKAIKVKKYIFSKSTIQKLLTSTDPDQFEITNLRIYTGLDDKNVVHIYIEPIGEAVTGPGGGGAGVGHSPTK